MRKRGRKTQARTPKTKVKRDAEANNRMYEYFWGQTPLKDEIHREQGQEKLADNLVYWDTISSMQMFLHDS